MKRPASFLLILGVAGLLLAAIVFRSYATAQGVPVLRTDAVIFLPQTLAFRERGELVNQVSTAAVALDSSGQRRMVFHGFLYPMFLSVMLWRGDWLALAGSLALVQGAATLLVAPLLLNFGQLWGWKWSTRRLLLILFLTAACANYTQGALGRAEPLAAIILMLAVMALSRVSARWHPFIAAIGIGTITGVDPVIGIFAGLGFGGYAAWRFHAPKSVVMIASAAVLSLAVFAAWFLWYPYPFSDWLDGTLRMGRSAFRHETTENHWRDYFAAYVTRGSAWMLALTLLLVLWSGVRMARRNYRAGGGPTAPFLFYGMVALGAAAVFRFAFYVSWASYNLLPLMPLGFLLVFYELGRDEITAQKRSRLFPALAFCILLAASLGFAGDLHERAHMLRFGLTLPEARQRFLELRTAHPQARIALHRYLFTLTEDYSGIVWGSPGIPAEADLWVSPQAYSGYPQPPPIEGFRLAENYFNPRPLSFLGFPLWRLDRGGGFAVYHRQ